VNPCGYGLDKTIRAVHTQKIVRPQYGAFEKQPQR
jgi:hypothetical protein